MIGTVALIAVVYSSGPALLETCRDSTQSAPALCVSYIIGVMQGARSMAQIDEGASSARRLDSWCIPPGTSGGEIVKRVIHDLEVRDASKGLRDPVSQDAALAVIRALTVEFNCLELPPDKVDPNR